MRTDLQYPYRFASRPRSSATFTPRFLRAQRDGVFAGMLAFAVFLYLVSFWLLVSQVLNTLGVGFSRSVGGFLIGLYLMLLISALNFVFLLYILDGAHRGPPVG